MVAAVCGDFLQDAPCIFLLCTACQDLLRLHVVACSRMLFKTIACHGLLAAHWLATVCSDTCRSSDLLF